MVAVLLANMPTKKSMAKPKAMDLGAEMENWAVFPCSGCAEVRIASKLKLNAYRADGTKTPLRITKNPDGSMEIENAGGVIFSVVAEGRDRHIFAHVDTREHYPRVFIHEIKAGFPRTDKVPSPCELLQAAKPRKKR